MRKRPIIRKDEKGVSPVIATILMVAITVVLAAVLYVMVTGLLTGPGTGPQAMGVTVSQAGGINWVLLVSSTPSGKAYTSTTLTILKPDGSSNLTATAWGTLTFATHGCSLQKASTTAVSVQVGDRILCRVTWYPLDSTYQISDGVTLLATSQFRN